MKPIIPILIPIYNGEPYIRECMDSVFGQTYHDFEIICMHIPEHTRSVFRRCRVQHINMVVQFILMRDGYYMHTPEVEK